MRPNSTADGCQNIADASGLSIKSLGSYDRSLKGWPITVQGSVKAYVASYQTGGLYDPKYCEPMEADGSKYCSRMNSPRRSPVRHTRCRTSTLPV